MAPDSRRRRWTAPAVAVAALVGLGLTGPAVAHAASPLTVLAAPKPTEKELRKQLDDLNTQAEILTEKFNKARVDLQRAQRAEAAAARISADLEKKVAPAREQLAALAAANYMSGGPDVLFGSGGADGLSDTAYLAQNQATVVASVQAEIDKANKAKLAAEQRTAQVAQAKKQVENARTTARNKIAEVQKQLDKLTTTHVKDPHTGLSATVTGSGLPARMARKALTKIGRPYVWGAAGPSTFDCSGLVVWAYAQVGKPGLPHYTGDLYDLGTKVSRGSLQSGDLVYFGSNLHHMGIYLGGGKFLHAPSTGDVVKISDLSDRSDFAGANRIS
ncbi:NlpC/P60 family protein [Actinomadura rayongensis]|uniref:NlpC/P60 family protein n=1 Tax=Actinomadura rayongensis TaxID=1429076 RepID=A0A6I4W0H8_9ACTN|nr:C40 family peptidase [Actinomadura rayongensis]MXQ62931.1 NlpC/P60 family protein [Actinomadura rayongensis]